MHFAYRMIRVSVVSYIDSCFSGFIHRYGCSGCTIRSAYTARCTAIALQSIYLFQSHCILFRPPTLFLYIHTTPDIGVFLALRKLEHTSYRPLFGLPLVVGSPKHCYSYSPCVLDHKYSPDVAHAALISAFTAFIFPQSGAYDSSSVNCSFHTLIALPRFTFLAS